jgi:hypothetical protein
MRGRPRDPGHSADRPRARRRVRVSGPPALASDPQRRAMVAIRERTTSSCDASCASRDGQPSIVARACRDTWAQLADAGDVDSRQLQSVRASRRVPPRRAQAPPAARSALARTRCRALGARSQAARRPTPRSPSRRCHAASTRSRATSIAQAGADADDAVNRWHVSRPAAHIHTALLSGAPALDVDRLGARFLA